MDRLIPLASATLFLAGCPGDGDLMDDDDDMDDGIVDVEWESFLDRREADLRALGEPILDCVARTDTGHPAFHGCIDWHSAVHGTWALHVLARLLEDDTYLDAADDVLDPESVAGELADVTEGELGWEIPYGYAWFLALAREREEAGRDDLRPLADTVAADLTAWLDARTDAQLADAVLDDNYGNASWALLNLYEWAGWTGDTALARSLAERAEVVWLPLGGVCPVSEESQYTRQFFPPCLHRMMVLDAVLDGSARVEWLLEVEAAGVPRLSVVDDPSTAHGAGLNFSRAWGLWALWRAGGDPAWRSLYVEHVVTHLDRPEYWAEDYRAHSHWIPQFGIRALSLTYE